MAGASSAKSSAATRDGRGHRPPRSTRRRGASPSRRRRARPPSRRPGRRRVCAPRRTQRALFLPSGARTIHDDFSESATLAAVSLTGRRLVCCAAALMTAVRCRRRPRAARFFSRSSSSQIAAPIAPTPRPRPNRMARLAAPLRTGLLFLALLAGSAGASLARAALPPAPRAAPSRSPAADRRFRDRAKTPRPRAFPPPPARSSPESRPDPPPPPSSRSPPPPQSRKRRSPRRPPRSRRASTS